MIIFNERAVFRHSLTRKIYLKFFPPKLLSDLRALSMPELFDFIRDGGSIARFGDGEFSIMTGLPPPNFQSSSSELKDALLKVLKSDDRKLLICIPSYIHDRQKFFSLSPKAQFFWYRYIRKQHKFFQQNLSTDVTYGDALVSRPYLDTLNSIGADYVFNQFKDIVSHRKVIVIEGNRTRFGVGNDLLVNAQSVSRILAPSVNAFNFYPEILKEALKFAVSNTLFILCLGPTAKPLALDLVNKGYQVLDVGHLDVEYEWYRMKAKEKVLIPGKYVNEVSAHFVEDPFKNCKDYLAQIVSKIN